MVLEHAALDVGVEPIEQVARQLAEAQSLERRRVEQLADLRGGRLHRVVEQPRIGDRCGERADVIELPAERHHARRGDVSPLGFEPDDAAGRGRNADRSARVGADRAERHAGRDRGRRSAARSARRSRRVVRIARRAEARVFAGRPERELVEVGLADEHRAGFAQAARDDGIRRGDVILADQRTRRGRRALLIDQILERDRNAVQRPEAAAAGDLLVGLRAPAPAPHPP